MIRIVTLVSCLLMAAPALAQGLSALARLDAASIDENEAATTVTLELSQPVPWRLFLVDGPPRLVIDFNKLNVAAQLELEAGLGEDVVLGQSEDGWTRMVVEVGVPVEVEAAGLKTQEDGSAVLTVALIPTDADSFAAIARPIPQGAAATERPTATRPVVVIDPGHGGLDPGAEADGLNEKVLMLSFARDLEEALIRGGLFDVALTRETDEFVPLETRISRARAAGGDVFLSLHADELPEGAGEASGITVYTLAASASDEASRRLAERHDKDELLEGVTVDAPGDEIALVLMDIVRRDTRPRSNALAEALKASFRHENLKLAGRPLRSAAFSVLKAPDIPSVLIELGFLSSEADRKRLTDPVWRASAVQAIESALVQWALEDEARSNLLRR